MDSNTIKQINEYNFASTIQTNPVIIRKRKNETSELLVVTIGCTREEYQDIKKTNTLNTSLLLTLKGNNFPSEKYIDSLIFLGDLTLFREYEQFVYKFPQRKIDIRNKVEPQFRLYTKTLQEQQDTSCYIRNLCNSARVSWNSVIRKVGSNYGVIFTYKIPRIIKE